MLAKKKRREDKRKEAEKPEKHAELEVLEGLMEEREAKKDIRAEFCEDKVVVFDDKEYVFEPGYFGKIIGDRLELALVEALLLMKRGRIRVFEKGKELSVEDIFSIAKGLDKRFVERYRIYEDLRERGLLVRTGFKFGCDFRVYERGVQLKRGPKSQKEHTKWIVFSIPEDYICSFQELSRAVRLAHNIRARMLWAVVDNEGDCTYYQVLRMKP